MTPNDAEALEIKQRVQDQLLAIPGVQAVGFGAKVTNDAPIGEFAIRVLVRRKLPANEVAPSELIPPEIEGVKTDVVELGRVQLHNVLEGGVSITATPGAAPQIEWGSGTLGCVARTAGISTATAPDVLLTCRHVLIAQDEHGTEVGRVGDLVNVTSASNCWKTVVARVLKVAPWTPLGKVDAAIAKIESGQEVRAHTYHKPITGTLDLRDANFASLPQHVRDQIRNRVFQVHKFGRTTGLTHGHIVDVHLTPITHPTAGPMSPQIQILSIHRSKPFSDRGDSGAVVYDNDWKVVGLLWGGDDLESPGVHGAYASFIADVEAELQITVATNPPVTIWRIPGERRSWLPEGVHRDLVATGQVDPFFELYAHHQMEIRGLLAHSRPFVAAWRRNHAPLIIRALQDLAEDRIQALPSDFGGQSWADCVQQIAEVLLAHGSPAVRQDALRTLPLASRLGGCSYAEAVALVAGFADTQPPRRRGRSVSGAGTLEELACGLGTALAPLQYGLKPANARFLFAQLGLLLPDSMTSHPELVAALNAGSSAAGEISPLLDRLAAAIESDDAAAALVVGVALIDQIRALFDRLDEVGTQLEELSGEFPGIPEGEVEQFPARLLDLMLVGQIEASAHTLTNILAVAGLIERHRDPATPTDETHPDVETKQLRLDRVGPLLESPTEHFQSLYGWGSPGFDGQRLFSVLASVADHLGLPSLLKPASGGQPLTLDLLLLRLQPDTGANPPGLRADLRAPSVAGFTVDTPMSRPGWRFTLRADPAVPSGTVARISPPGSVTLAPPAGSPAPSGGISLTVTGTPVAPQTHMLVFGIGGATRLEAASLTFTAGATLTPGASGATAQPTAEFSIQGGRFLLGVDQGGSLLTALIPKDRVRADLDLGLLWANGHLTLRGSANLVATFPVNLSLGPVELQSITVGLTPGAGDAILIEVSATVKAIIGPLSMLVQRVGLTGDLTFPGGTGGNLGPLSLDLGFRLPTGIGLELDAGPVTGGGFLQRDPGGRWYGGVLQVKLAFFNVTAFGIYEATPSGDVSFVAVLGIRFTPGIQLSFGFALTGVGGLVGLNRRANTDLIRERLASGAAGNVLFCDDPVKNAPSLLGDMDAFFPVSQSGFLVGPTLQISWLQPIVRLDVGLVLEFPGPSKIPLFGSLRAMIGDREDRALLFLRMDFLGAIDFQQQLISFDAQLVNSQALGVFRLTGGAALRIGYGDHPYIVLTIGGFNPRFDPGPLHLPVIPRLGATLDVSFVARAYVRLEMYLAFTANTLQAGAHVEAGLELGPLEAHGHFDFDALVQFRPFVFEANFSAGFAVEALGLTFVSVHVEGRISGPGPVVIHARGYVKRFGIKVKGSGTFEFGEHNADALSPIPSVVQALQPELNSPANLRAEGTDPGIILKPGQPKVAGVLVSPRGSLIWEQKRAPLHTLIDRLEGTPLVGQHQLAVAPSGGWSSSTESDWFSPGAFTRLDLGASQSLNNAGFEKLPSGLRIGQSADKSAAVVQYTSTLELVKRPGTRLPGSFSAGSYLTEALTSMATERTLSPLVNPGPAKVQVSSEPWDVFDGHGEPVESQTTSFQAFQRSRGKPGRVAVPSADIVVAI